MTVSLYLAIPLMLVLSLVETAVLPTTPTQISLAIIWESLLGREQIGIHANFFDIGGHSLLATQVVSRIRDQLSVELSQRRFFEIPTIAELAEREGIAPSYMTRVLRLTLLAPDIVDAILDGKQGPEVTLAQMLNSSTVEWMEQANNIG